MNIVYMGIAIRAGIVAMAVLFLYKLIKIIVKIKKRREINYLEEIITGIFAIYIIVLLVVTLRPASAVWEKEINLIPFKNLYNLIKIQGVERSIYTIQVCVLNVLMLVPFGCIRTWEKYIKKRHRGSYTILEGVVLILFIELTQHLFVPGRTADIDDFILNLFGVIIGIGIAKVSLWIYKLYLNKK